MHTCGKLMVILISCSMLSFVLGSDLHSLFAQAPRTLSMLNLLLFKGSHAEQSSLCNLVVWLRSPAIENTGHQKETPYFAISKITAEKVMWKRLQAEPRCEDEENFMLSTNHPRVTRTWWPLHAWGSVSNACRSTPRNCFTCHRPSREIYV